MQPQGHVQFLIDLIDFKMNPQEALDAQRIRYMNGMEVYLEDGIPEKTITGLEKMGHRILRAHPPVNQVGGGQAILFDPTRRTSFWEPPTGEKTASPSDIRQSLVCPVDLVYSIYPV